MASEFEYEELRPRQTYLDVMSSVHHLIYLHQVAVDNGTRLTEGKVSETCEAAGMRAVCSGPSSCKYTNVAKCVITPLSSNCNNPM